ncbi:MAG: ATP-binding protein [Balneolaceae bacterium]
MPTTITEKKGTELIQLNDEIESFFSNHIIAQLFVDADFILRKFTSRAQQQFDLLDEHLGEELEKVIKNIGYQDLDEKIQHVLDEKKEMELEIEAKGKKWYQLNISPYASSKQEEIKGVILTFIDITERIEYLQELERLNEEHESFIYSISNDLREPLLNVVLHIQDLEDVHNEMTKKMFGTMKKINSAVNDMSDFILEITDFLRNGEGSEEEPQVNIEEILEDIKLILRKKLMETGTKITTELNAAEINFARKKIRSILYTLICNAVKYKAPDRSPRIFIKTEAAEDQIHITVQDNGIGISKDEQEALFKKPKKYPAENKSLGIGLHLVKKMINDAGGKIEVMSTPGKGSTFYVYLKRNSYTRKEPIEKN